MIVHGHIHKVQFSPPKEGEKDKAGNAATGLFQVFWTDASRPSEFRSIQTLKSYAGAETIQELQKAAGSTDLTDAKITVAIAEFKVDKNGGFYIRGGITPGHLTGDELAKVKRGGLVEPSAAAPAGAKAKAA